MTRIGIIGAGAVTAATIASLIAPTGLDPEIIIVNRTHSRAVGLAEDFTYASAATSRARVRAGDYADLAGADLVIITAGVNEKDGGATDRSDDQGRRVLDLIEESGEDVETVQSRIREAVTYSNISIIEGIGASQHGIGAVVGQITEAIADDSHAIMPVASHREEYGTFVGLPTVLGRGGAVRVLVPELTPQEQEQLDASAAILREADRIAFESAGL